MAYDPSFLPGVKSGGSSSSSTPLFGLPMPKASSGGGDLTANQLALLLALQKRKKHFSLGSILKGAGKKTLNPVLWTFDKLMRPSYASVGAIDATIDHPGDIGKALSGAWKGFSGQEKLGLGEVFKKHGVLKGHGRLRGVAGFVGDVATDPLMLLSTAAAPITGGGSVAAYTALKAAAQGGGKQVARHVIEKAAKDAAFDAGRLAHEGKVTDDVLEVLSLAGKGYTSRLALANQVRLEEKIAQEIGFKEAAKIGLSQPKTAERTALEAMAHAEQRVVTKRGLQIGLGTRKHKIRTPVEAAGRRISPRVPQMRDIAGSKIPVLSKAADKIGEHLVPGFKREELHAAEIARQHYAEYTAKIQKGAIADIMAGKNALISPERAALTHAVRSLDQDDQLQALHMFEQPMKKGGKGAKAKRWKAVIAHTGVDGEKAYTLNEDYIKHLEDLYRQGDEINGLSAGQVEFVRRFHDSTQMLYARDWQAGVRYADPHLGESGRLYVPHMKAKGEDPLATTNLQKNIFSQSGFQKKRMRNKLSVHNLHELVQKGVLPDAVETDPYHLLTSTSRARAEKQADMIMIHSIEKAFGIPTRIVDGKVVEAAAKEMEAASKVAKKATRTLAKAEEDKQAHIEMFRHKLEELTNDKIEALDKTIRKVRYGKLDNKRLGSIVHEINAKFDRDVAKLRSQAQAKYTKLDNATKAARAEADKAEAAAEKAIKGKITYDKGPAPKKFTYGVVRAKGKYQPYMQARGSKTRQLVGEAMRTKKAAEEVSAAMKGAHDEAHAAYAAATGKKVVTKNKSYITRTTRQAAAKMERAEKLEADLRNLTNKPFEEDIFRLEDARDKAIKKAQDMGRINQKRTKGATIARLENQKQRLKMDLHEQLAKVDKHRHPVLNKELADIAARVKAARAERTAANKKLGIAKAKYTKATDGKKNPAFNGKIHTTVGKSKDGWGNSYGFTKEVAHSLERLTKITAGEEKTVEDFAKGWGKWMSTWKLYVTSVNPGYRIRNSMTDFWNMWVSGMPAWAIPHYGKQAVNVMRRAEKGDPEAIHILTQAATHGILSGLYAGDVQSVAKFLQYSQEASARHPIKAYIHFAQKVNREAENWGRMTHYLYQTRNMKRPPSEAALKVKLAHFDYEDLTPFEQKVMKKVFPFYTWTRKNIPFQVKMIMQHPGRYAAFPKMAQEAELASGADPDREIPEYLSDNFAISLGKNRLLSPQFGVSDLAPLQGPAQAFDRLKGMVTPFAKTPFELMTNKSLFTGQPIASDTHGRNPVGPVGAKLLSLIPGSDVGTTQRGGNFGPGANPYYTYLLGQIPALRFATSTGAPRSTEDKVAGPLSYLGGISTSVVDPEAQRRYQTANAQEEATKLLTTLRDAGLIPPAKKRKLSAKEQYIQNQIFGP